MRLCGRQVSIGVRETAIPANLQGGGPGQDRIVPRNCRRRYRSPVTSRNSLEVAGLPCAVLLGRKAMLSNEFVDRLEQTDAPVTDDEHGFFALSRIEVVMIDQYDAAIM